MAGTCVDEMAMCVFLCRPGRALAPPSEQELLDGGGVGRGKNGRVARHRICAETHYIGAPRPHGQSPQNARQSPQPPGAATERRPLPRGGGGREDPNLTFPTSEPKEKASSVPWPFGASDTPPPRLGGTAPEGGGVRRKKKQTVWWCGPRGPSSSPQRRRPCCCGRRRGCAVPPRSMRRRWSRAVRCGAGARISPRSSGGGGPGGGGG